MNKILFRIISDVGSENQREYKIFEDGKIEGFGENSVIANRLPPIISNYKSASIKVVDILSKATRVGNKEDNPEGSRYVQLSETLINDIIKMLKCED